jgi:hypothetical protein
MIQAVMSVRLHIDKTWDGVELPRAQHAVVELSAESGTLLIQVDAPLGEGAAPAGPPGPTEALWEHEVVELLVVGPDDRYLEIELGPWGHHLVLRLEGVRRPVERLIPIGYETERAGDRWTGVARVPRALLPPGPHRINAFSIIEIEGARRFHAWSPVPGDKPDFHRIGLFPAQVLPEPGQVLGQG